MSDSKAADLLQYAQEYASKDVDIYDLLGVDALTPKEDIHRAWRKRSLKYHPDKAGDNFDAEKWQLFERARDVLSDPAARAAYDGAIKAALLRKQEREAMDKQRKHFRILQKRDDASRKKKEKKKQDEAREKFLRKSRKATETVDGAKSSEPLNGVMNVPGDFSMDFGTERRLYWELVCDKLRAVQAVRNLQKGNATTEEYQEAEKGLLAAKMRIHQAEVKFAEQASVS
ncbi:hypothetical protein CEP52_001716 [Fusarium oligoseptatum]|uniref:J domain-containing protein n=1 Tax=Fusarium oligoseptatum TaxID=2604345 RepID=A0A428UHC6_9HYPO|nr:hypothetical protein CEP52_001716 [Fusarium oligoseptatum]